MSFIKDLSELRAQGRKKEEDQEPLDQESLVKVFKVFGRHYKKHWKTLTVAYLSLFAAIAMAVLSPWPLKLILDHLILRVPLPEQAAFLNPLFNGYPRLLLLLLALAIVAITVLEAYFSFINKFWLSSAGDRITAEIRERVFAHLNRLSLSFHESASSGNLVYVMTSDISEMKSILIDFPQDLTQRVVTFGAYAGLMLALDWRLGLIAMSTLPLVYIFTRYFRAGMKKAMKKARKRAGDVTSIIAENIGMMAIVQAYSREKTERERLYKRNLENMEAQLRALRMHRTYSRLSDLLIVLSTAGVLYWGGHYALDGGLLPGTLVVFVAYMRDVTGSFEKFTGLCIGLAKSQVSAERLLELVENEMVIEDDPNAAPAPPLRGRIEFKDVSFAYKAGHEVLKNLNFVVEPGETVALIGHSGAGKSTLISLLLRFYDPQHGKILVDGEDIRRFTLKSLRRQMTILLQDAKLFRQTVRENIAFGKAGASEEEIVAAAKAAEAHDFIMQMPDDYDTMIHEGGENLSGGQRQRLNIARAIIRNTPILFLDEPTTGLDARAEANVNAAIQRLTRGKTTFIIAHRFGTFAKADKILLLEEGQLAHQGTHEQLMRESPQYRELYELQFGWQQKMAGVETDADANNGHVAPALAAPAVS